MSQKQAAAFSLHQGANWYPDPTGEDQEVLRWWDGQRWTEHTYKPTLMHKITTKEVLGVKVGQASKLATSLTILALMLIGVVTLGGILG